jgi:hypothetical protein
MHFFSKLDYQYVLFKFRDDISAGIVLPAPAMQSQSGRLYLFSFVSICLSESEMALLRYCQHLLCKDRDGVFSSAFSYQSKKWHRYCQHCVFIFSICLSESEVASLLSAFAYKSQKWHLCFASICLSESEVASLFCQHLLISQKGHLYCQHLLIRVRSGIFILPAFAYQSKKGHLFYQHFLCKVVNRVFIVSICCAMSEMGSLLSAFAVQSQT